ncbi:hypothetical protein C9I99_14130 [Photobacterium lutimaris]|uniref:Uncharacterized protein n=1 Tax=Photobacterium lutimaris TaxID=388278 RepID=A0A2T3IXT7_9GAMM|nr:hypothetical protein C9I99_14130 [Photobacterium lutimaris]
MLVFSALSVKTSLSLPIFTYSKWQNWTLFSIRYALGQKALFLLAPDTLPAIGIIITPGWNILVLAVKKIQRICPRQNGLGIKQFVTSECFFEESKGQEAA